MVVFVVTRASGSSNLLGVYSTKKDALTAVEANGGFDSPDGFQLEEVTVK